MNGRPPETAAIEAAQPAPGRASITRLKKRPDFLKAAKGERVHSAAFVLQCIPSAPARASGEVRFGFTVSKKNGNAVVRNRIRRRLKAALATASGAYDSGGATQSGMDARAGYDYVVIARPTALTKQFPELVEGLRKAVRTIHDGNRQKARRHTKQA